MERFPPVHALSRWTARPKGYRRLSPEGTEGCSRLSTALGAQDPGPRPQRVQWDDRRGKGQLQMTSRSSELAGVSPVESRERVPVFFRHGTPARLWTEMVAQLGYSEASGPGWGEAGAAGPRPDPRAARATAAKAAASCAGPRGAHLVAAPGLFTVALIESD